MLLEDKIYQDYVAAMKAQDKPKIEFLSFIRAAFRNAAIDLKAKKLEDKDALAVLQKQQKRLMDTKESLKTTSRADLIEANEKELALLAEYLPKGLSPEELTKIIAETITQLNAAGMKDMGRVMKEVSTKIAGRADTKSVSELVKAKLS
jgi:uncharacterized protein YqeY